MPSHNSPRRFNIRTQHGTSDHYSLAEAVGIVTGYLQPTSWREAYEWVRIEFWLLKNEHGTYWTERYFDFRSLAELRAWWSDLSPEAREMNGDTP